MFDNTYYTTLLGTLRAERHFPRSSDGLVQRALHATTFFRGVSLDRAAAMMDAGREPCVLSA